MSKSTYSIKKLRGVDLRGTEVDSSRVSYMKNLLPKNGINQKRNGWETVYRFTDKQQRPLKINGIFEYKDTFVVHAGEKLYKCSRDFSQKEEIQLSDGITLENRRSNGCIFGDFLWISGAGGIMLYDGVSVKSPYEHEKVYVPVTASGITDSRNGAVVGTNRSPNLFTKRRRNGFRVNNDSTGEHLFLFDSPVDMDKPLSITVTFRVRRRNDIKYSNVSSYIGKTEDGKEINTIVYGHYYTPSPSTNSLLTLIGDFVDAQGQAIKLEFEEGSNLLDFNSIGWPIIIKNPNELFVMYNPTTPKSNYDNVVVEYTSSEEGYEDVFGSDAAAFLVNWDNGNNSLAICDGGGRLFYTQGTGRNLYLPKDNCITLGAEKEKITAVDTMLDNYIAVYKKNAFYRIKLQSGEVGKYQVVATSDREGSVNSYCACSLDEDSLCFNENGIFGTREPIEADEHTSILFSRDSFINQRLVQYSQAEKENACFVCHKGMAYLFIGGDVFVAHKDYRVRSEERDFEYEWWIFDNCPVTYAASLFNELYMGREDGYISVFKNGFSDVTYVNLDKDMYHYLLRDKEDYTEVIFDFNLGLSHGDTVYLGEHYVFHSKCTYDSTRDKLILGQGIHFDNEGECAALYDGMEILVTDLNGEAVLISTVQNLDLALVELDCAGLIDRSQGELKLYIAKKDNTPYTLIDLEDHFALSYNGGYAHLYSCDVDKIYLRNEKAVESAFFTSPLSLKEGEWKKTLFAITLYPTSDTATAVKVGYETFESSDLKEVNIGKYSAFDEMSLSTLDFCNYKASDEGHIYESEICIAFYSLRSFCPCAKRLLDRPGTL